jgi:hypothetical protein
VEEFTVQIAAGELVEKVGVPGESVKVIDISLVTVALGEKFTGAKLISMSAFFLSLKPMVSSTVISPAVKRSLYSSPGTPSTVRPAKVTIPAAEVAVAPDLTTPPVAS